MLFSALAKEFPQTLLFFSRKYATLFFFSFCTFPRFSTEKTFLLCFRAAFTSLHASRRVGDDLKLKIFPSKYFLNIFSRDFHFVHFSASLSLSSGRRKKNTDGRCVWVSREGFLFFQQAATMRDRDENMTTKQTLTQRIEKIFTRFIFRFSRSVGEHSHLLLSQECYVDFSSLPSGDNKCFWLSFTGLFYDRVTSRIRVRCCDSWKIRDVISSNSSIWWWTSFFFTILSLCQRIQGEYQFIFSLR